MDSERFSHSTFAIVSDDALSRSVYRALVTRQS